MIRLLRFFIRGFLIERWYDFEIHRFIKPPQRWRISIGLKAIPIHKNYYGFLLQAWSHDVDFLQDLIDSDKFENFFVKQLEDFLGYPEIDWWFEPFFGIEDPEVGEWSDEVMEKWQFRAELRGLVVFFNEGDMDEI